MSTDVTTDDATAAVARLTLDPDGAPIFCAIHGRKGSGKSEFLRFYARWWPYEALIIDPTGDLDPDGAFTRPWPGDYDHWPSPDEELDARYGHRRFRVVPNRNDPEHRKKVDRLLKLAYEYPGPVFVGIDEGRYLFASDEKIEPGSDIVQNEGRHGQVFLFVANPRAIGLRPVFHHQADWIVLFGNFSKEDLDRIVGPAGGLRTDELAELCRNLEQAPLGARGEMVTGFVLIDIPAGPRIAVYPILPL